MLASCFWVDNACRKKLIVITCHCHCFCLNLLSHCSDNMIYIRKAEAEAEAYLMRPFTALRGTYYLAIFIIRVPMPHA